MENKLTLSMLEDALKNVKCHMPAYMNDALNEVVEKELTEIVHSDEFKEWIESYYKEK